MAIIKNIELENGIKVDGAYLRVEFPSATKDKLTFNLRKYVEIGKPFFHEEVIICSYDLNEGNPFMQAYKYLKTLESFKDAEDC